MWAAGGGGKLVGRRLQAKARKHEANHNRRPHFNRPERRQNYEEEFRLIFSEVDKYNQMKAEIRGRRKQSGGL